MNIESTPPIVATPNEADMGRYREALEEPEDDIRAELSRRLAGREFILVRGFLTDVLDRVGVMMKDQLRAVEGLGCPVRTMRRPFDSENPPDVNATAIASMVKSASLPVILITHSKGSVDTLTALVGEPAVRGRIAGWVSIQGAVQGSPVADFLVGRPANRSDLVDASRRAALHVVFDLLLQGSLASLDSLRTRDRVEYLRRHAEEIARTVAEIPTVAFGSAAPRSRSALRTVTAPFFAGEPNNDGLMSVERTIIPGARIVHDLDGPDHGDAVMHVPGSRGWNRVRLTYALLRLLP
jgi:hypothetical protein